MSIRVILRTNASWVPSGYGNQAKLLAARLAEDLGPENVAISAFFGAQGAALKWDGYMVYPEEARLSPDGGYSDRIIQDHYRWHKADLVITLLDVWVSDPHDYEGLRVACWVPQDSFTRSGPGISADTVLRAIGATPIAMSRFGERVFLEAGLDPRYVPHCVDTNLFRPPTSEIELREIREEHGVPQDVFIIGMCAANADKYRKGFAEQFEAFAIFHADHPDSMMVVHSELRTDAGIDLAALANELNLLGAVRFSEGYLQRAGLVSDGMMARWFRMPHVLSNTSWGEGFGLPIVQAQASGVPVIVTGEDQYGNPASSMPELCGSGWKVKGRRVWAGTQNAWWVRPDVDEIVTAYERAYRAYRDGFTYDTMRVAARAFAERYDADTVYKQYWRPLLDEFEQDIESAKHGIIRYAGFRWKVADEASGDALAFEHEGLIEPEVMRLLPTGGVFLDVGAHVGHYTLRASRKASRVIAVEANPETCLRLRENLELNDVRNVDVFNVAAWDEVTELRLHSPNAWDRDGSTRVLPPTDYKHALEPDDVLTEALPLDTILGGYNIDLVKMDIEGADLHALRGMRETLARCRPTLFIEDHSIYGYYKREDLENLLAELGYEWRNLPAYRGYIIATPV